MSDNAYINDLEGRNAELRRELAEAKRQIASQKRRLDRYSTEHVPVGYRPVVAFMNDKYVSIMADATTELGEEHNCDANGCGQEHVAYLFPLDVMAQLTAANATIAACKEAGFIDAEGRVRRLHFSHVVTKDGAIVPIGEPLRVYHPESIDIDSGDAPDVNGKVLFEVMQGGFHKWLTTNATDCYSTPAAAKEAQ